MASCRGTGPGTRSVFGCSSAAVGLYAIEEASRGSCGYSEAGNLAGVCGADRFSSGLIEFESSIGGKMRIQWKGSAAPDWISLLRAWQGAER